MKFNEHSELRDKHSFLSPSKYHWLRYDDERLIDSFYSFRAAERGTRLHAFAKEAISLGVFLNDVDQPLNQFVNDAIGYKMTPEQVLYYSQNCFGSADAIGYRRKFLRIHDLKTGKSLGNMDQLKIYAALFCLEYDVNPADIKTELRLYTVEGIISERPEVDEILWIMRRIKDLDKLINNEVM